MLKRITLICMAILVLSGCSFFQTLGALSGTKKAPLLDTTVVAGNKTQVTGVDDTRNTRQKVRKNTGNIAGGTVNDTKNNGSGYTINNNHIPTRIYLLIELLIIAVIVLSCLWVKATLSMPPYCVLMRRKKKRKWLKNNLD